MGCNCKKDNDIVKGLTKYSDEGADAHKPNIFTVIAGKIGQFIFGIIAMAIVLVLFVPILVYVFFCLILGKQPHIRIYDIRKRLHGRK